jgi:hypothetical protein
LEAVGLDDWTTHMMAFSLSSSSSAKASAKRRSKLQRQKTQLMQFPTTATPEGRSWLWASMLQEIEVSYGLMEMTSEHSKEILDFLMHHAGLSIGASASASATGPGNTKDSQEEEQEDSQEEIQEKLRQ